MAQNQFIENTPIGVLSLAFFVPFLCAVVWVALTVSRHPLAATTARIDASGKNAAASDGDDASDGRAAEVAAPADDWAGFRDALPKSGIAFQMDQQSAEKLTVSLYDHGCGVAVADYMATATMTCCF